MTGTERKCFQKYYPADFDPSKLQKAKRTKGKLEIVQRVMVPFNMQCNSCAEYIYKGKKFNMNRETVQGEAYLGLKLFRFQFNCPNCMAHITFKTDLEHCDYKNEHGATRLDGGAVHSGSMNLNLDGSEAPEDPMKTLEKRQKQSLLEMRNLEELEDLQEKNRGKEGVDYLKLLEAAKSKEKELEKEEDARMARDLLQRSSEAPKLDPASSKSTNPIIKRKYEQKERFAGIKLVKKSVTGLGLIAGYVSDSET
ncbi:hypothetical protein CAEBREN_16564 [Caenorhabditis brenneri]|uniref:Splicing factor YJU2 n=1 Tax=Caenorhabditis brenneri TaxID=135651 RepID=G0PB25_CAEBE|nr:hypothetical protein CAEBREN_16564 [Caenorhabditis brenneri]